MVQELAEVFWLVVFLFVFPGLLVKALTSKRGGGGGGFGGGGPGIGIGLFVTMTAWSARLVGALLGWLWRTALVPLLAWMARSGANSSRSILQRATERAARQRNPEPIEVRLESTPDEDPDELERLWRASPNSGRPDGDLYDDDAR